MLLAITVIGFLVGVCIYVNIFRYGNKVTTGDAFRLLLVPVGITFLGFIAGLATAFGLGSFLDEETPVTYNVVSMGDAAGVSGRFFLGSGSVDTQPVFFYYSRGNDGSYGLYHVPAKNTRIVQDDDETPRLEVTCPDASTVPEWVFWPLPPGEHTCDPHYDDAIFYVPEGSIDNNFNLDAQ